MTDEQLARLWLWATFRWRVERCEFLRINRAAGFGLADMGYGIRSGLIRF